MKIGFGGAWVGFGLLISLSGCSGAEPVESDVASIGEELGVSCADAQPSKSFVAPFDFTSPQTYNPADCYKGQVIDRLALSGLGPPPTGTIIPTPSSPTPELVFEVSWADNLIGTKAECEASVVRGYLFRVSSSGTETVQVQSDAGEWRPFGCAMPAFLFDPVPPGEHYRIAANARPGPSSGAATRKVRVRERPDL